MGGALISWHGDDNAVGGREVYPAASRLEAPEPGRTGSGGVYCAGQTGLAWEWIPGGVLSSVTCDGRVLYRWAFTPSPPGGLQTPLSEPVPVAAPWEASWPEEQWANVAAVDACESSSGAHPDTYRLDAVHGGRMQIARAVWAEWLLANYGWTWSEVVTNVQIQFAAAYIIWERAGSWAPWPYCARGMY